MRSVHDAEQEADEIHTDVSGLRKGRGRKYSQDLLDRVLDWMECATDDGMNLFEISRAIGIAPRRLDSWRRRAYERAATTVPEATVPRGSSTRANARPSWMSEFVGIPEVAIVTRVMADQARMDAAPDGAGVLNDNTGLAAQVVQGADVGGVAVPGATPGFTPGATRNIEPGMAYVKPGGDAFNSADVYQDMKASAPAKREASSAHSAVSAHSRVRSAPSPVAET